MALNINTNIGALGAAASASAANRTMESAMERLSTGLRINTAADDAAGMAISSRMEAQIRGLNMAIRNAADGQALIDTTEGAHNEVTNILQRMRELAVQSANDTNVSADRANLQAEVSQLQSEINRISSQTTWNGVAVLDGTFTSKALHIGADQDQTLSFSVDSVATTALGAYQQTFATKAAEAANTATNGNAVGDTLTITGHLGSASSTWAAGSSAKTIAQGVNDDTAATGVSATAKTKVRLDTMNTNGTLGMTINGTAIATTAVTTTDLTSLRDAINAIASTTGVVASMGDSNGILELEDVDGDNIVLTAVTHSTNTATMNFRALSSADAVVATEALTMNADTAAGIGYVEFTSSKAFTLNATTGTDYADASGALSSVANVNIATRAGSESALKVIDGAINKINAARGDLGAISNRLDNTISNLTNISTNIASSQSRIQDADFAAESTNLAKAQILQQAATAMLAQANASKQGVLSLLQG